MDYIMSAGLGTPGSSPIQIRSSAKGSGNWYSGSYRPFGITMTWHNTNNAGHIVFGQVAASGSTVKTNFIGLQMMSWDGYEYFCLSTNYAKVDGRMSITVSPAGLLTIPTSGRIIFHWGLTVR